MKVKWLAPLIGLGIIILVALGFLDYSRSKRAQQTERAQPPVCVLAGDMKGSQSGSKGFDALGSMIRIKFEVSSLENCKRAALDYCSERVTQGFRPGNMTVIFHSDSKSTDQFSLSGACMLYPEKK